MMLLVKIYASFDTIWYLFVDELAFSEVIKFELNDGLSSGERM